MRRRGALSDAGGQNATAGALEGGEIVGYLAVATSTGGVVGTLARGEQIGPPAAFARGRVTPGSLGVCPP